MSPVFVYCAYAVWTGACGALVLGVLCDVLSRRQTRRYRLAESADKGCDGCFLAWLERDTPATPHTCRRV
jgi:hypothetical protein